MPQMIIRILAVSIALAYSVRIGGAVADADPDLLAAVRNDDARE